MRKSFSQVEPGAVDVVVVVLDEAGALAHHALALSPSISSV